jgi:hypothetical protein
MEFMKMATAAETFDLLHQSVLAVKAAASGTARFQLSLNMLKSDVLTAAVNNVKGTALEFLEDFKKAGHAALCIQLCTLARLQQQMMGMAWQH